MNFCKSLLFLAVFGWASTTDSAFPQEDVFNGIFSGIKTPLWNELGKEISDKFMNNLLTNVGQLEKIKAKESHHEPILPPYDDPLLIEPFSNEICLIFSDAYNLKGDLNLTSQTTITGLSQLTDDFNLTLSAFNLDFSWDVRLPSFALAGDYLMDLMFFFIILPLNVNGNDLLLVNATDIFLSLNGQLRTLGYMKLNSLNLDLGFKNFNIDGGTDAWIEHPPFMKEPVQWDIFSNDMQQWFDTTWTDEGKSIVEESLLCSINNVIEDCRITDIINGDLSCLKLEHYPECFGENYQELCFPNYTPGTDEPTSAVTMIPTSTVGPTITSTIGPTPTSTMDPDAFSCENKPNGFYPHPYDCAMYIGCHNGDTDYFSCSPPLLFDPFLFACNYPENVNCQLSCDGKPDGFYPHPQSCSLYIGCYQSIGQIFKCQSPLLFDPVLEKCNFPQLVDCSL